MVHGDQKGLVLPPKIAPFQIVIIPITTSENRHEIIPVAEQLAQKLKATLRVVLDTDETKTPGAKYYHWELRGVPIRIELGPRDIAKGQAVIVDRLGLAKSACPLDSIETAVQERLSLVQTTLFERAIQRRNKQWHKATFLYDVSKQLDEQGGFYQTGWCGSQGCEKKIKEEFLATIRCVLPEKHSTLCGICQQPSIQDIIVARAY